MEAQKRVAVRGDGGGVQVAIITTKIAVAIFFSEIGAEGTPIGYWKGV